MEGKTKRTLKIWETLEKEIPQLDHLLEITGKEQITSFLGFYFQRKLLSQIGKEVAPANSWRISELSGIGKPWLCCALAQPHSLLEHNAATPYARAHSQWDNTILLAYWEETLWLLGWLATCTASCQQQFRQDAPAVAIRLWGPTIWSLCSTSPQPKYCTSRYGGIAIDRLNP